MSGTYDPKRSELMATKSPNTTDEQRDRLQHIDDNDEQALDDLITICVQEAVDASDLDASSRWSTSRLIATGGDDASYLLHVTAALDAGASVDEITGVLTAVGPNVGVFKKWPRPARRRRRSASTSSRPVATATRTRARAVAAASGGRAGSGPRPRRPERRRPGSDRRRRIDHRRDQRHVAPARADRASDSVSTRAGQLQRPTAGTSDSAWGGRPEAARSVSIQRQMTSTA
jgi:hypothetical protein